MFQVGSFFLMHNFFLQLMYVRFLNKLLFLVMYHFFLHDMLLWLLFHMNFSLLIFWIRHIYLHIFGWLHNFLCLFFQLVDCCLLNELFFLIMHYDILFEHLLRLFLLNNNFLFEVSLRYNIYILRWFDYMFFFLLQNMNVWLLDELFFLFMNHFLLSCVNVWLFLHVDDLLIVSRSFFKHASSILFLLSHAS